MSGNSLILDTNTVLYFLGGDQTISDFIKDKNLYISFITELELLSFDKISPSEVKIISDFLTETNIINISQEIKDIVISLRRANKLKLPDSIIAATAIALKIPLFTADKGIKSLKDLNVIYYEYNV
jgi:predicted nucleic acid-binding protein